MVAKHHLYLRVRIVSTGRTDTTVWTLYDSFRSPEAAELMADSFKNADLGPNGRYEAAVLEGTEANATSLMAGLGRP